MTRDAKASDVCSQPSTKIDCVGFIVRVFYPSGPLSVLSFMLQVLNMLPPSCNVVYFADHASMRRGVYDLGLVMAKEDYRLSKTSRVQ